MKDETIGNQQRSLEQRLAWLGGIVDGEGTISFASKYSKTSRQKNYHFRPEFRITNTDDKMIEEIISIFEAVGCPYYIRSTSWYRNPNHKIAKEFRTEGLKRLEKLLPIILPYLICKREQAELVLQYINSRLAGPHQGELTAEQEEIILKVKQLNHRGVLNRPESIRRTPATTGDDVLRTAMKVAEVGGNVQPAVA